MKTYVVSILILAMSYSMKGQTCCSAGAPTSSSLEIGVNQSKQWSLQLGYEYKSINLLVNNNERLTNDPRSRSGQNVTLKFDFGLSEKWAFSAFLPFVQQTRSTISEKQNSFGPGDLLLLAQHNIYLNKLRRISISGGIKLPTGITNHKTESSIFLSPDMQSGSGSVDYLVRLAISQESFLIPFLSAFLSGAYRKNGVNNSFGKTASFSGRRFGFGDELMGTVGLKYLWATSHGFITPDLSFKWRNGQPNIEESTTAPNSGGNWLSLPMGISFTSGISNFFRAYVEVPMYQSLDGLQITSNLTVGVQYKYTINQNSN